MGYKHWLLVEGPDDQHVLRNLLRHYNVPCAIPKRDPIDGNTIVIDGKGGIENLFDSLQVILDDGDLERLGIVVDANTNIDARWVSLCNILIDFGDVNIPANPDPHGTIMSLGQTLRTLTVGVWIMPNNKLSGILEDFIGFLVPEGDLLWERAKNCVEGIPETEQLFPKVHKPKANIHTWLAWQEEPGTPLGLAITKRYFDVNVPHAQQLVNWTRRLFDLQLDPTR
jgi:hypothetical protein